MNEDADACSLPSDAVYLNVRRSVITARKQVSQAVLIWNALRSETVRICFQQLMQDSDAKTRDFYPYALGFLKMGGGIL